ncbi:hypothetical protein J3F83DRAFT_745718 [Trichoderma novae-zelandiae]
MDCVSAPRDARVAPHVRSAQRGSVEWHRVGDGTCATQRSKGSALASRATSAWVWSVAMRCFRAQIPRRRTGMSQVTKPDDSRQGETRRDTKWPG